MDILEKLNLLKKRHSVRTYTLRPIEPNIKKILEEEIENINKVNKGLKFHLVYENDDPFRGFFRSYGTFKNPRNYLVAEINPLESNIEEIAGYYAERFVIKCVESGIGTCFVGGTYDPSAINISISPESKISFIVLFGYESEKTRWQEKMLVNFVHRKNYELSHFFEPSHEFTEALSLIPELKYGIEAVAAAPSAVNKRPVRLFIKKGKERNVVCAKVEVKNYMNNIDLGIAKYNYNFVTSTKCAWGNGAPLSDVNPEI